MRILINGKEGPVGLMPPLGTTLSDDQIAGVLTFVRRSWGNQGIGGRCRRCRGHPQADGRTHTAVD